jgi:hypothetical protein
VFNSELKCALQKPHCADADIVVDFSMTYSYAKGLACMNKLIIAVSAAALFCTVAGLRAEEEARSEKVDMTHIRREAKRLRNEAEKLRKMAEKLDRELEDMEDVALLLRSRITSLQASEGETAPDPSRETVEAIAKARNMADELTLKARDLSVKIREMEEMADRREKRADSLEEDAPASKTD